MKKALVLGSMIAAGIFAFAIEGDAQACGGCFPPTETPSIVTDHRMIFTIARDQSTLYDQIKYSGSPSSFAWVLPIVGEVKVGLSSDSVFQALDAMTQTTVIAPPRNCPPPPDCPNDARNAGASGGSSSSGSGGVEVTKREQVGPYDTVQLKATDPAALQNWLQANGFQIPADVKPIVDQYVNEKFDFLALKLLPGKDVQDMRPVRITTPGANNILPLRMVAAGTGANVGISLWMIGEGRYEPQNFPTFAITTDELLWDWNTNSSNYKDLRAQKTIAGGGKAWEIESSMLITPQEVTNAVTNGYYGNGRGGGQGAYVPPDPNALGYLPVKDQQGNINKTALQVRDDDFEALFHGVPASTSRITRLRADLAKAALATDLSMAASANQDQLSSQRQVTKEANQPLCPVYNGCEQVGTAPRDQAAGNTTNGGDGTFSCATVAKNAMRDPSPTWLALGGGFLALALTKAARRRSQNQQK